METLLLRIFALAALAGLGSALPDDELLLLSPEELCKDRLSEEYFRLKVDYDGGDCRDVVRCDRAGAAGTIRLAAVRCPAGLAFDIFRQTCDWKAKEGASHPEYQRAGVSPGRAPVRQWPVH